MKTKVRYKPEGFNSVTPYLCVNAASKLLDFLKQAFGAEELGRHPRTNGSMPHACVKIGDSMVELGDVTGQWLLMPRRLHICVPDAASPYQRPVEAGRLP